MNSEDVKKEPKRDSRATQWWNTVVDQALNQAFNLANEAAQSPLGASVIKQMDQWVSETGPQIAGLAKRYASEISRPYLLGMGIELHELTSERIEVYLPHRWRNRSSDGSVHFTSLTTLAEEMTRQFWEHSVQGLSANLRIVEIHGKFVEEAFGDVTASMEIASEESEAFIEKLKTDGQSTVSGQVEVLSQTGSKVADFFVTWQLRTEVRVKKSPSVTEIVDVTEEAPNVEDIKVENPILN